MASPSTSNMTTSTVSDLSTTTPEESTATSSTTTTSVTTQEDTTSSVTIEHTPTGSYDDEGLGAGAIAGIIIAAVLVIGCIIVVTIFLIKWKKKNHAKPMKRVSRKKWSEFLNRLTGYNRDRRPTIPPNIDDLMKAEQQNNDHNHEELQLQEEDNQGYQPDVSPRVHTPKPQTQAPDIHISVNPDVSGSINNLDGYIPSPDDVQVVLTSGQHYDYPQRQRGSETRSGTSQIHEEDEGGIMESVYDHPQSQNPSDGHGSNSDDVDTDERDDIYSTPTSNMPLANNGSGKTPKVHSNPRFIIPPPPDDADVDDTDDGDNGEKRDYVNVVGLQPPLPHLPVRKRDDSVDVSQMVPPPPPSHIGHAGTPNRRYINVPEVHQLPVTDGMGYAGVMERPIDGERRDSHPHDNANTASNTPAYANLPIANALYVNQINETPTLSDRASSGLDEHSHETEETYIYTDSVK